MLLLNNYLNYTLKNKNKMYFSVIPSGIGVVYKTFFFLYVFVKKKIRGGGMKSKRPF